jgi:DNA-binding beta-propeller fold protein YncE
MSKHPKLIILAALALLAAVTGPVSGAEHTYKLLKEISIGGEGGWDYLAVDQYAHRLYVTHGSKIVVLDLDNDSVIGEITDTPGVHGFAIAPKLNRGFSSNGQENKASIVDLKTLKTISKVETGQNPDAILYDPAQEEVYTFNGRGASATVFEAKAGKVVATIPLSGKPEFAVVDSKAGRIYCNLEDKNAVAVIDTKTHKVLNTWPIAPGEEASGMAFDAAHHRLFLGCHNKLMLMVDSTNGKVLDKVAIGSGVDACKFDRGLQLAFSSCGDGTVTIAHEESPDKLVAVQTLKTEPRARTMALDPSTHKIYLASAKFEPALESSSGKRPRPKVIAGSFKVLVYGP